MMLIVNKRGKVGYNMENNGRVSCYMAHIGAPYSIVSCLDNQGRVDYHELHSSLSSLSGYMLEKRASEREDNTGVGWYHISDI